MRNSTITIKKKLLSCSHFDYNFSKGRCKQCATVQDFYNRQEKEIESDATLSDLIKEADAVFSQFVRLSAADKDGMVDCYTCSTKLHYKQMQNGHYISRGCMFLRFDIRDCRPQCQNCNEYKRGNLAIYGQNLEKESLGITEILNEEKTIIHKYTREDLREIINEYSTKVKILLLNIKR